MTESAFVQNPTMSHRTLDGEFHHRRGGGIILREPGWQDLFAKLAAADSPAVGRLNFGDCLTYPVARVAGRPLFFVGGDFSKTDLPAA